MPLDAFLWVMVAVGAMALLLGLLWLTMRVWLAVAVLRLSLAQTEARRADERAKAARLDDERLRCAAQRDHDRKRSEVTLATELEKLKVSSQEQIAKAIAATEEQLRTSFGRELAQQMAMTVEKRLPEAVGAAVTKALPGMQEALESCLRRDALLQSEHQQQAFQALTVQLAELRDQMTGLDVRLVLEEALGRLTALAQGVDQVVQQMEHQSPVMMQLPVDLGQILREELHAQTRQVTEGLVALSGRLERRASDMPGAGVADLQKTLGTMQTTMTNLTDPSRLAGIMADALERLGRHDAGLPLTRTATGALS